MQQIEFQNLIQQAIEKNSLPEALTFLKESTIEDVAAAAQDLTGQFALADMDGVNKVYHVTVEINDEGKEEEFLEFIMNRDDDTIVFVTWFFFSQFSIKASDVYRAAGKTYKQPKRN